MCLHFRKKSGRIKAHNVHPSALTIIQVDTSPLEKSEFEKIALTPIMLYNNPFLLVVVFSFCCSHSHLLVLGQISSRPSCWSLCINSTTTSAIQECMGGYCESYTADQAADRAECMHVCVYREIGHCVYNDPIRCNADDMACLRTTCDGGGVECAIYKCARLDENVTLKNTINAALGTVNGALNAVGVEPVNVEANGVNVGIGGKK